MIKYYATFDIEHGRFLPDNTTREITKDTVDSVKDIPEGCYGFSIWSRKETEIDGEILKGEKIPHMYVFYGGEVLTLEQVKNDSRATDILISNMECNRWGRIIYTRFGRCLPFDDDKHILVPVRGLSHE